MFARTPRQERTTRCACVVTRIETEGPHHGVVAEEPGVSVVEPHRRFRRLVEGEKVSRSSPEISLSAAWTCARLVKLVCSAGSRGEARPARRGPGFDRALRSSIRSSPWSSRARRSAAPPTVRRTGDQVLLAALIQAMANASTESVLPC
jgi:hypothetical protein